MFVGGCSTGLLISDAAADRIRATKDVDTITEIGPRVCRARDFARGAASLGLTEDHIEDARTCRWCHQDLIIDVMPADERILRFSNQWYARQSRPRRPLISRGFAHA